MFVWIYAFISLAYIPGVEFLGHMETLCFLSFWKTANLVLKWLYHFAFPLAVYGGFTFSIFLSILVICLLNYSHSSVCGMHTLCVWNTVLICIFLVADMLNIFSGAYWLYIFCGEMSVQILLLIFQISCLSLILRCKCSLYILDTSSLIDTWFANLFYSVGLFHFLHSVLWRTKVFNFDEIQFIFFYYCFYLKKKNHCLTQSHKDLCLYFLLRIL